MSTALRHLSRTWRRTAITGLVAVGLIVSGCTVKLISSYDEQVDRSATALQQTMDRFLTSLDATPQPTVDQSKDFYRTYESDLRSLLIRVQSQPQNSLTERQVETMMNSLQQLRTLHSAGPLDVEVIKTTRDLFNQSWRSIITLELAKKRGG